MSKSLHESLTVRAAVVLALVVLARAWLPRYGVTVPAEVYEIALAAAGIGVAVGARRAIGGGEAGP